jgi:hypothetical protein
MTGERQTREWALTEAFVSLADTTDATPPPPHPTGRPVTPTRVAWPPLVPGRADVLLVLDSDR